MSWTPELIASLENFWNEGLPTTEIGRRLGMSKNAVIGKAHRLGLSGRPSPIRRESRPARPVRRFAGPACQWPIGDPRLPEFHFCGEPVLPGKPYCASHCAVAYTRSGSSAAASANSGNTEKAA
ncbi:MAG: GcrA family cell cycle regulator [Alphaproteobacteria bacterium]